MAHFCLLVFRHQVLFKSTYHILGNILPKLRSSSEVPQAGDQTIGDLSFGVTNLGGLIRNTCVVESPVDVVWGLGPLSGGVHMVAF